MGGSTAMVRTSVR